MWGTRCGVDGGGSRRFRPACVKCARWDVADSRDPTAGPASSSSFFAVVLDGEPVEDVRLRGGAENLPTERDVDPATAVAQGCDVKHSRARAFSGEATLECSGERGISGRESSCRD